MRWTALVVLCLAGAGLPQDMLPPPCRCLYEQGTAKFERVDSTGDPWLDKRIRSERSFLKSLFRIDAEFVLFGDDAPRDAFVTRDRSGKVTIGFKASWLVEHCSKQKEHRTARTAYALAHQHAHAVQSKMGCTLPEISRERHADLLAGWYLGRRNIATLKGAPPLNPKFARLVFARPAPYLNEPYEHGTPEMRAKALAAGFRLWRTDRLKLKKVYHRGLAMYPPANVGLTGAGPQVAGPLRAALNLMRQKVGCTHRGACTHQVPCKHPKECVHKVACRHMDPCNHRTACIHQVACTHKQRCVHRTDCTHRVRCVHTLPCVHRKHRCDFLHVSDFDEYGMGIPCVHEIPCTHFLHRHDYQHNFDYAHDFDYEHEFDPLHDFDLAHEFDTEHAGHPRHDFDMAHEWDPVHDHDLAHESDPVHDYDITLKPKNEK